MFRPSIITVVVTAICALSPLVLAQDAKNEPKPALDQEWVKSFDWRLIGPANMSGRIVDLEVYEPNPKIQYIASASGGLIKTVNNGVTYDMLFQHQSSISIGDVALASDNPDLVWIGTGEHNPRNSVSWGDGVYKSTDGGKSWSHMGLEKTFQIGKVLIHPQNHDTVFVGAMGRLWGPNEDRGLYRTTDGGKTWEKVLYIDDKTGIIDMAFHPDNPDIILAAAWERGRDEFDTNDPATRWGPGSGLYRTEDGGDTWTEITEGLPTANMGRMGMDFSGVNHDTVYMLVDSERIGQGIPNPGYLGMTGSSADVGARMTSIVDDSPAAEAGLEAGDIVIRVDDEPVLSYDDLVAAIRVRPAGTEAVLEVVRKGEIVDIEVTLGEHPDPSGKPFERDLGGQRESIQDQQGDDGFETGGLFKSEDAGKSWTRINSINPRPIYFSKFFVDPSDDNYMWILGIPLSKSSDGGVTWTRDGTPGIVHVDHHALWIDPNDGEHMILGNDGGLFVTYDRGKTFTKHNKFVISQFYHITVDNQPLYMVYGGLQDNGSWGGPNRSRGRDGPYITDWFRVGGGDGFICEVDPDDPQQIYFESQNGGMGSVNLRTGKRGYIRPRPPKGTQYRWNWKTPFMLSHHNSEIYYTAGNHVFRSYTKGEKIKAISPEIARTRRGSATAFDESPVDPDLLMVGTDDGSVWVTRDGGKGWENIVYPYDETAYPEEKEEETSDGGGEAQPRGERVRAGGPGGRGGIAAMLKRFDANDDGKLQIDEMPERMRGFGKMFDADGDGAIGEVEMGKVREFMRAMRGETEHEKEAPKAPEPPVAPAPSEAPAAAASEPEQEEVTGPAHPLNGAWICTIGGDEAEGAPPFNLVIQHLDEKKFSVEIEATILNDTTKNARFNADTGMLSFSFTGPQGTVNFTGQLEGGKLVGNLSAVDMGFEAPWSGTRDAAEEDDEQAGPTLGSLIPGPRRVQSLEWSKFKRERVYLVFDGHYYDDDQPYVFVSEDAGKSWASLRSNLPAGSTRVLREDLENQSVLYLGTEFGLWVSVDRGGSWTKFNSDLPSVSIHEVAQHESNGEIVVGTHGRGAWALDVTPLRQMTESARHAEAHLYKPNTVVQWRYTPERGRGANGWFAGENPPRQATIYYSLGKNAGDLEIEIRDAAGKTVRVLDLPANAMKAGLHKIVWDLRAAPPQGSPRQRFRRGRGVGAGTYRVVLSSGDAVLSRTLEVINDPDDPDTAFDFDAFVEGFEVEEEGLEPERDADQSD
jgi:photosystem II stability/assembly factor-like uncharacterized protein